LGGVLHEFGELVAVEWHLWGITSTKQMS
jgi:hypothetical protein